MHGVNCLKQWCLWFVPWPIVETSSRCVARHNSNWRTRQQQIYRKVYRTTESLGLHCKTVGLFCCRRLTLVHRLGLQWFHPLLGKWTRSTNYCRLKLQVVVNLVYCVRTKRTKWKASGGITFGVLAGIVFYSPPGYSKNPVFAVIYWYILKERALCKQQVFCTNSNYVWQYQGNITKGRPRTFHWDNTPTLKQKYGFCCTIQHNL